MAPLPPNTGRPQVLPANPMNPSFPAQGRPMQDTMMRPGMMPIPQQGPDPKAPPNWAYTPQTQPPAPGPAPAPQTQPPAPGGAPQVSPGRTALIRSVMARAGQPKGGMGQPQVGRPMPQMAKPRAPIFKPPGG